MDITGKRTAEKESSLFEHILHTTFHRSLRLELIVVRQLTDTGPVGLIGRTTEFTDFVKLLRLQPGQHTHNVKTSQKMNKFQNKSIK
jgi:hypothetical protein